jgi:hypothetical protein
MNPIPRFSRVGSVRVVERAAPPLPGVTTWVADEQVGIDVRLLQHFSFAQPTPFTYDLMTVVSAIRCADRQVQRLHSEGWARDLAVEVPVYEHNHKRIHCGLCGNCILRRSAAMAANIEDETTYLYKDLTSTTMESGLLPGAKRPRGHRAYADLASNGARSMQRLAELALNEDALAIWSEAANIAEAQSRSINEVKGDLTRFLQRHADQWNAFLNQCGSDSWIATMARG